MDFSRSSGDSSESDCLWDDEQHWDSHRALLWLEFLIASGTGALGRSLGINAAILPYSLAWSCVWVAYIKASKSVPCLTINLHWNGGFEFNFKMFKTFNSTTWQLELSNRCWLCQKSWQKPGLSNTSSVAWVIHNTVKTANEHSFLADKKCSRLAHHENGSQAQALSIQPHCIERSKLLTVVCDCVQLNIESTTTSVHWRCWCTKYSSRWQYNNK